MHDSGGNYLDTHRLRAGFRAAWANKDYEIIINIAKKVPDEALQEDEKLLTLYDLALTRTEEH